MNQPVAFSARLWLKEIARQSALNCDIRSPIRTIADGTQTIGSGLPNGPHDARHAPSPIAKFAHTTESVTAHPSRANNARPPV